MTKRRETPVEKALRLNREKREQNMSDIYRNLYGEREVEKMNIDEMINRIKQVVVEMRVEFTQLERVNVHDLVNEAIEGGEEEEANIRGLRLMQAAWDLEKDNIPLKQKELNDLVEEWLGMTKRYFTILSEILINFDKEMEDLNRIKKEVQGD